MMAVALALSVGACGLTTTTDPAVPTSDGPIADTESAVPDGTTIEPDPAGGPAPTEAQILAKSDSTLSGTVTLTPTEGGVVVVVDVTGVAPGKHGVHFHERADCSASDGTSAGGHFDPDGHDHALPSKSPRHLGDLGNIEVRADGTGRLEVTREGANLRAGDPRSFVGRGLVVHADEDDGGQPTGNAGERIGCAEIHAPAAPTDPEGVTF